MLRFINRRRYGSLVMVLGLVVLILFLTYTVTAIRVSDASRWQILQPSSTHRDVSKPRTPPIPAEYEYTPPLDQLCIDRFSPKYLEDFRDHAISYCKPGSRSQITCFHGSSRTDLQVDSMCIGQGVDFNTQKGLFDLECSFREVTEEEKSRRLLPFNDIRAYWYNTGPREVFKAAVTFRNGDGQSVVPRQQPNEQGNIEPTRQIVPTSAQPSKYPRNYILLKREGVANTWHSMMETFSSYITMDVLRISADTANSGKAFFDAPEDIGDTGVVILDDMPDGPYFETWTLFAKHKPIRLQELKQDPEAAQHIKNATIIVPLPGGSNPLWQPDASVRRCASAATVSVFSNRVLSLYGVSDPLPPKPDNPIRITFIDRQSRRLVNQTALLDELQQRYPLTSVRIVDFAAISFEEQLQTVRKTDILVGVHGAGLTHSMFMRENVGTVVEIQPKDIDHFGFRMVAAMRGLSYFTTHGLSVPHTENQREVRGPLTRRRAAVDKRGWQDNDVRLEPDRFFELMDSAIKSMFSRGVWDHNINRK